MQNLTCTLSHAALLAAFLTVANHAAAEQAGCDPDTTRPATAPDPGADGSAPGNAGNTGWTGGTGGSHIGTSNQGSTEASRTWQPPTVTGLDLSGSSAADRC